MSSAKPLFVDLDGTLIKTDLLVNIALLLAIAVLSFGLTMYLSGRIDPALYGDYGKSVWFEADIHRVLGNMTSRMSDHGRLNVHPLFSLAAFPIVSLLQNLPGLSSFDAALLYQAAIAGIWGGSLFVVLRLLRLSALEATAGSLLGISSASSVMWFSVTETFGISSLSLLATMGFAALALHRQLPWQAYVVASAASLSMTVTNWMAGLALVGLAFPIRRAVRLSLYALAAVAVLALLQKLIFPSAGLFFLGSTHEHEYMMVEQAGSFFNKLAALVFHAQVMPEILTRAPTEPFRWSALSVQHSVPGSGSFAGGVAIWVWVLLLSAGAWGAVKSLQHRTFTSLLALVLGGQILLHLVYGDETFLYTQHLTPLWILLTAFTVFTRLKRAYIPVALLLSVLCLANNLAMFEVAEKHVLASLSERDQVKRAMREQPDNAWPRGDIHMVVGQPGGSLGHKGYAEPGGSFSPAPGSFGVAVWVSDKSGKRIYTGDTVNLTETRHAWGQPEAGSAVPALVSEGPGYRSTVRHTQNGWTFELLPTAAKPEHRYWIVIRSVGPAGGPLRALKNSANGLSINDEWTVSENTPVGNVNKWQLGNEKHSRVTLDTPHQLEKYDAEGWLYAVREIPGDQLTHMRFVSSNQKQPNLPPSPIATPLETRLPDTRFTAAMNAQIHQLLMGVTDGETRPGDPINYESEWLRDGAYIVLALARSGQIELATKLANRFVENDFLGGFGSEGDAPGMALWVLGELASTRNDSAYDKMLWPHFQRKAALIEACLNATEAIRVPYRGQIVPALARNANKDLVCSSAKMGLARGRMDGHIPVLFINAMSFNGLRQAAHLARRLGNDEEASRWENRAVALEKAWKVLFDQDPESMKREAQMKLLEELPGFILAGKKALIARWQEEKSWFQAKANDRTYISGLWPSGIASGNSLSYSAALESRWKERRDDVGNFKQRPDWTYFELAEAHQWLYLGHQDKVWQTLDWFYDHQSFPGLYSWWEGKGEDNTSRKWDMIRGWISPKGVTPHYWTAAELLLLQLDMLAYTDESSPNRAIVIGAGIKPEWLAQDMQSGTVHTARGPVAWFWRAGKLQVETVTPDIPIRLAGAFKTIPDVQRSVLSRKRS
jgi:hypothetical protein